MSLRDVPGPGLRIQLLGGFSVTDGGAPIPGLESPRLQSLLARLALRAGVPQTRAHLAFTLWPDTTEVQARTNLRNLLFKLRRSLPDPDRFLTLEGHNVTWRSDAPYTLDVAQLERALQDADDLPGLMAAAGQHRGDLLPGVYDDWIDAEREHVRATYLQLLDRIVARLEARGDYPAAVAYARRILAHEPLDEAACVRLMRLQARQGDRAGLVSTYNACDSALRRELGVAPSPETRRAYEEMLRAQRPSPSGSGTATPPRTTLPAPLTAFVGREREVEAIVAALGRPDVRLLTLTGTGGTGKTRLALQAAMAMAGAFADGVSFVGLASVTDPRSLPEAVGRALGVPESRERTVIEELKSHLGERELLLLLDNFEHLLSAAPLVTELLAAAPRLTVLTTSRSVLRLYGEHVFPAPPLDVPDPRHIGSVETVARYDAVRLFVERARAVRPAFRLTEENGRAVAEICQALHGLPLAIELAAARSHALSPREMLERLGDRLSLASKGARDLPPRHRTLRGAIGWSDELLDGRTRVLFARLGVFADGCTTEAAAAVCVLPGEPALDVRAGLAALVHSSLLREETGADNEPRYGMLEAVREYALERLDAAGGAERLRRAHAVYYRETAERARTRLEGPEQAAWLDRLEEEIANVRAALSWAVGAGETELALATASALERFWYARGRIGEGRRWLEAALAAGSAPGPARARALGSAGWLAAYQGDYAAARPLLEESLAAWKEAGDDAGIAHALNHLASVAMYQGEHERAGYLFEESLAFHRRVGDARGVATLLNNLGNLAMDQADYPRAVPLLEEALALRRGFGDDWIVAASLNNLGLAAIYQGDYGRATALHEESLDLFRRLGDKDGIAFSLGNLGFAALYQGDDARAAALLRESLALFREVEDEDGTAYILEGLAAVEALRRRADRAARLWGAAEAIRDRIQAPLPAADRAAYERYISGARDELGEADFGAAWGEGRRMTAEQATAYALSEAVPA